MSRDILDVAIVGGGVSGCYCGYRLLTTDRTIPRLRDTLQASGRDTLSVALYECSDRIGGRIWSYRFPETPNRVAEVGGICFSPLHANVFGLCTKELRLEPEAADEFNSQLQYLRAHRFSFLDYKPQPDKRTPDYYPGTIPYFLDDQEKWKFPTEILLFAFTRAVPDAKCLLEELVKEGRDPTKAIKLIQELDLTLRNATVAGTGQPLHDTGFWNLLSRNASQEAYDMATMSSGFYSTTQNWNAYNTLLGCFVDFSVMQTWTKLKDGYEALPCKMAERFAELGGQIYTGVQVCGLEMEEVNGETVVAMKIGTPGVFTWVQRARNVILAIPQRAVSLLDPNSFLFRSRAFVEDLSKVTCEPACKLFLTFAEPWWTKAPMPVESGQSSTDLPMRLCFYLGSETNGASLMLASFTDSVAIEYWNGFFRRGRFGLRDRPIAGQARASNLLADPPSEMVQDAIRQLSLVHGLDVPAPISAAFVNWTVDPYGGGYHFWNTHTRSWEVMPRIRRPVPGANVFLCGEAFSAKQGWVEGALNTAEMTLETYFGLPRPGWLPDGYNCGP